MGKIKSPISIICIVRAKFHSTSLLMAITFLFIVTSTSFGQSQSRSDFYGVKLEVVNKPEIKRDLARDWSKYYPEPVDEDSRYELFLLEELETRRQHLLEVFKITFKEDGDLPRFILNREPHLIPDRFFEIPATYALLEHIESYLFHHIDVAAWEKEKKRIYNIWTYVEWSRKMDYALELRDQGVVVDLLYEYYEYYAYEEMDTVLLDDLPTTWESLGYISVPPLYPPKPKRKGPVFGFDLWEQ